ncbi:hypothetical protein COLO4_21110 [Corchorus olitorius]|uniref:SHSP domain-containing protein n=1 Tax=Corchorus olitorius TaxID=93759 RepID=A0A1R3IVA1_9ROSI|nr:hypothetical protein COLO4_21110 [Corchorus olitorius]
MDLRAIGFDPSIIDTLHELLDIHEEGEKSQTHPSRAYIRDSKAMAETPADVKETPNAYVFVIDMPGLKQDQLQVQVEEGNLLTVCGQRKREKDKDQGVNYIKMERRLGKYLKKFQLPDNADTDKISASYNLGK